MRRIRPIRGRRRKLYSKQKAMSEVDAGRDRATPASVGQI
jgi:hypothetical protein